MANKEPVPEYALRPARQADLEQLVALYLELQHHLEASNPEVWRMTLEARGNLEGQLQARMRAVDGCAWVAQHKTDGIVGMVFGRITVNHRYVPARTGTIDQLYVRAGHRRRGLGSALVGRVCDWFRAHGVEDVSLRYVSGNEEAEAFWTAQGFSARIVTLGARVGDVKGSRS